MTADSPVLRFAPSPNGELHLGHAYSALLNAQLARRLGGRLLLRIEDIDATRCTPEFETGIYRDLEWLGIEWQRPVRRQSEHLDEYRAALERLAADELVYPAFMSRGEIRGYIADQEAAGRPWPRDPDGAPLYPPVDKSRSRSESHRRMADGEPFAWRLDMENAMAKAGQTATWREFDPDTLAQQTSVTASPRRWGDVVLARKETPTSYHLAVVLDDALQGITHIVRGKDLFDATSIHRLLQQLLGLPEPLYHHHALILGPDGRKLSKSFRDTGIRALRDGGASAAKVRTMVAAV